MFGDFSRLICQVASNVFGLTWAVLDCNEQTTLDDFGYGILVDQDRDDCFNSKSEASNARVLVFDDAR
jgi:hypothetical protein